MAWVASRTPLAKLIFFSVRHLILVLRVKPWLLINFQKLWESKSYLHFSWGRKTPITVVRQNRGCQCNFVLSSVSIYYKLQSCLLWLQNTPFRPVLFTSFVGPLWSILPHLSPGLFYWSPDGILLPFLPTHNRFLTQITFYHSLISNHHLPIVIRKKPKPFLLKAIRLISCRSSRISTTMEKQFDFPWGHVCTVFLSMRQYNSLQKRQ